MKRKFVITLEENLIKELKKRSVEEGRSVAEVIEEAFVHYLRRRLGKNEPLEAWQRLNSAPVHATDEDFQVVLQLDLWEQ